MKQKYYRLDKILKQNATYNILLGEKSNGKSYAVKEKVITDAYNDPNRKFILLRRWDFECKPSLIEMYFRDAPVTTITNDTCDSIAIYRGEIWLTKFNDETRKNDRITCIGYVRALSMEQHYASGAYPDVTAIVYEEFISRDSYLPQEPMKLMYLVSTVARRRKIDVFMIGNTITRINPYFREWQLLNIPKQKQGTIDIYKYNTENVNDDGTPVVVTIAVEFCENSGNNSKMFFGIASKTITTGAWECKEMPHLNGSKDLNYSSMYTIYIQVSDYMYKAELLVEKKTNILMWFVCPQTKPIKSDVRLITDRFNLINPMTTIGMKPLNAQEAYVLKLLTDGKVCYSDNLTGTDFEVCLKKLLTNF